MALSDVVQESFRRSFELYEDLVREIPESALGKKLPNLRSNSIGSQLWCVIGARESFSHAIETGAWAGFSCSLTAAGTRQTSAVRTALASSAGTVLGVVGGLDAYDDTRNRFVVELLEHEAAHRGQLIRYLYGLRLRIPAHWKARYALD